MRRSGMTSSALPTSRRWPTGSLPRGSPSRVRISRPSAPTPTKSTAPPTWPRPGTRSCWMKWLRSAESAARLVAALIVAALFAVLIAGVFARYGFGRPLAWTDEVAAMLFVWLVFWTGAFVLRLEEHVAFDIVYDLAPPGMRRVLGALGAACAAALLFWALPKVADYVAFLWRERTPVLQLRQDFLYACFPAFVAMTAVRLAAAAFALVRTPAAAK